MKKTSEMSFEGVVNCEVLLHREVAGSGPVTINQINAMGSGSKTRQVCLSTLSTALHCRQDRAATDHIIYSDISKKCELYMYRG